jgi:hypothetical protein
MLNKTILEKFGYQVIGTGGGCTSWSLEKNGYEMLIGSDSGHEVDDPETIDECGLSWQMSADHWCSGDFICGWSKTNNIHNILKVASFLFSLTKKQWIILREGYEGNTEWSTDDWAEENFFTAKKIVGKTETKSYRVQETMTFTGKIKAECKDDAIDEFMRRMHGAITQDARSHDLLEHSQGINILDEEFEVWEKY